MQIIFSSYWTDVKELNVITGWLLVIDAQGNKWGYTGFTAGYIFRSQ